MLANEQDTVMTSILETREGNDMVRVVSVHRRPFHHEKGNRLPWQAERERRGSLFDVNGRGRIESRKPACCLELSLLRPRRRDR